MAYYDPKQNLLQLNQTLGTAGQYPQMTALPGQTTSLVGASQPPVHGRQRIIPQVVNAPYASAMPQLGVPPTAAAYSTSPAAQYIAGIQPGVAAGYGAGVPQVAPGQYPGQIPGGYPSQPYPGQPAMPGAGAGVPIPGAGAGVPPNAAGGSYSYPGANPCGYGQSPQHGAAQGDHHHHHHGHRRKRKSKLRKILEELLAGSGGIAVANYLENRHHKRDSELQPGAPPNANVSHAPKGSALGFLHPQGHFVPRSLEEMIDHFVHGRREKDVAPEGAKPGYLHPGGHFIPTPIEHLIDDFKWTLLDHHGNRRRHHNHDAPLAAGAAGAAGGTALGRRNRSRDRSRSGSSSGSEYYTDASDASDSTTASSSSVSDHRRHGRHRYAL